MALSHPILLHACLACAASAIGTSFQVPESHSGADERYSQCIRLLRNRIRGRECRAVKTGCWLPLSFYLFTRTGNQDTTLLHLLRILLLPVKSSENEPRTKMSAVSQSSDHRLRGTQTWPTLVFERVFIEAFLYHCMVMLVQETSPTPLQYSLLRPIFDSYFEFYAVSTSPEAENWLVFGMHYPIIQVLSDLFAAINDSQSALVKHS